MIKKKKSTKGMNKQFPKEGKEMANKHILKCSKKCILLNLRCYFLPFPLARCFFKWQYSVSGRWRRPGSRGLLQISKTHLTNNLPICVKDSKRWKNEYIPKKELNMCTWVKLQGRALHAAGHREKLEKSWETG